MKGGIGQLMKQAQQMQAAMASAQEKLRRYAPQVHWNVSTKNGDPAPPLVLSRIEEAAVSEFVVVHIEVFGPGSQDLQVIVPP